jgi:HD superfamily phosphodiesterase
LDGVKNTRDDTPSIEEAQVFLTEAEQLNPGGWVSHSLYVGKAAQLIAQRCQHLDSEIALVLGTLHDIGRRFGVTSMRHGVNNYTIAKWKATFTIKKYFEACIGGSLYNVLPGVIENTLYLLK